MTSKYCVSAPFLPSGGEPRILSFRLASRPQEAHSTRAMGINAREEEVLSKEAARRLEAMRQAIANNRIEGLEMPAHYAVYCRESD